MFSSISGSLMHLRGTSRFYANYRSTTDQKGHFAPSSDPADNSALNQASWLSDAKKLIPAESLAGYLALQPASLVAKNPENVKVVLADVFLAVTFVVALYGSQDPKSRSPMQSSQPIIVLMSCLCFVSLVYAVGGQITWHWPIVDQALYGQISTAALGICSPYICRRAVKAV